jgi:SAM-dependent methyltransferase
MVNAVQASTGPAGLERLPTLLQAQALVLVDEFESALDVGAGHGELAGYLAQRGVSVSVLDKSPDELRIAQGQIQADGVRFVLADASDLARHIPPASQDAVFLTNLVEHIPSSELRWVLQACRAVLRSGGVCCVATRERHYRARAGGPERGDPAVGLFEIDALRGILSDSFEAVDAFTWDGFERFEEAGRSEHLFAVAHAADAPYRSTPLQTSQQRVAGTGESGWITAVLASQVVLPSRFFLRADLHVRCAPADSVLHFVFKTVDPTSYFWTAARPRTLVSNPARLMLSSELLKRVGEACWDDVTTIIMRVRTPSAAGVDVRISDVRIVG